MLIRPGPGPARPGPAGNFRFFYSMFDKRTLRVQLQYYYHENCYVGIGLGYRKKRF